jgi:membrane associated rhomboid family serine protease
MIPLRSSERVSSNTPVTVTLIAVNLVIFLFQATLSSVTLHDFVMRWGIVPAELHLSSLVTSMFLHGGWMHVLGNMLFLWVFGRNLEDLLGPWRFLAFYLLCGLAAGIVHVITNPYSEVPTVGASGAIAGVMGGYLMKFPKAHIVTLVPVFVFVTTMDIPAAFYLLYWFVIQFFSGVGSLGASQYTGGGVAFFAHVGGFVAGLASIRLFPTRRPPWRSWYEED